MPTTKPRVQVTLEPETHAVIERFAVLQGRSRGAVIAELLDSIAPSLTRTVALLEAAMESPENIKQGLRGVVEQLHSELIEVTGDASKQLDILLDQASEDAPNPHVVTRGSGTGTPKGSKVNKTSARPRKSRGTGK